MDTGSKYIIPSSDPAFGFDLDTDQASLVVHSEREVQSYSLGSMGGGGSTRM